MSRRPGDAGRRTRGLRILALAAALGAAALLAGCAAKPIFREAPSADPRAPGPLPGPAVRPPPARIEEVATSWLGVPYRYGGVDERGLDCSSLVQNVFADLGVRLPRTTKAQRALGAPVAARSAEPGDLLFFALESTRVNHVGIVLGPDRFIHASSSRGVVIDRLMDDYFRRRLVEARRVLPGP